MAMHAACVMPLPIAAGTGAARAMIPLAPGHGSEKGPDKLMLKTFLGSRMLAPVPIQHAHAWSPLTICAAATSAPAQEISAKPMNIVFVSAEVAPWSKTGGLGDVVGGLPIELAKRGHRVYSIAPRYDQYKDAWDTSVSVNVEGEDVRFFHTSKSGVERIWVDSPLFLAKVWGQTGSKLYGAKSGSDYVDNQRRFRIFNEAALEALRALPFGPGEECVIVCNDWHTALLPVLLKDVYHPRGEFKKTKVAMTIHNIAFQGRFWPKAWDTLGLPASSRAKFDFTDGYPRVFDETEGYEDDEVPPGQGQQYEKVNWLKAGFLSADKLLTVSPNYADEIASDPQKGVELDDVIRAAGGIEGIVNGMDTDDWCPTVDKFLDVKYDERTVAHGKAAAKETLQAELGLPIEPDTPLFGFIGRLEEQKGVDILLEALPQILEGRGKKPVQLVVLGTGKKGLESAVRRIDKYFPNAKGVVKFSSPLAHLITAGADFMLVPSRFEPCGLIQMHAMQYGTVPVVASTGGLVDTVKEGVTGFHMGLLDPDSLVDKNVDALAETVARAAEAYGTPRFAEMRDKCIGQELSWERPAVKWEAVLEELFFGAENAAAPQQPRPSPAEAKASVTTPVQNVDNPAAWKKSDKAAAKPASLGQAVQQAVGGASPARAPAPKPAGAAPAAAQGSAPASATASAKPSAAAGPTAAKAPAAPTASSTAKAATSAGPSAAAPASAKTAPSNGASPAGPAAAEPKAQPAASKAAAAGSAKNGAAPSAASKADAGETPEAEEKVTPPTVADRAGFKAANAADKSALKKAATKAPVKGSSK